MTVTYGFYNSVSNDRTYDAMDMGMMFDGVITDGVFEEVGEALQPINGTGMQVIVKDGRAWFDHTWTLNDADLALAIAASDLVNPRIDTVVLEVNESNAVRANTIKVITGTPAGVPVEPTLINTSEVHQHPIAHVFVGAGVSSILLANVTDLRGTVACPFTTVPSANVPGGQPPDVLAFQVFL